MATSTTIAGRIETGLQLVYADILDLPMLAEEWDGLADGARVSLSLGWAHSMADYLTDLDEHYRAGRMSPDQQARYRELLDKLRAALPIIGRLNLYPPPVSLEG
jgi:hypothetical protein